MIFPPMPIPALTAVIVKCWMTAEEELRNGIREKHPYRDEEGVTDLFRDELRLTCDEASKNGQVENAFLKDLEGYLSRASSQELRTKIARGLVATVSFHPKRKEEKTGGDLGVVIVRPTVQKRDLSDEELQITHDYKRGLLCQAKIFRRDSKWGPLTKSQRKTLPEKLSYFALLLYRFADNESDRRDLEAFRWQLSGSHTTLPRIEEWLKSGEFPELLDSGQLLTALARDQIGTNDKLLIERDIAPSLHRTLTITIRWRDGVTPPGGTVHFQHRQIVSEQKLMQGR